jgi:hydroxysqualene dehydroxylase
VDCVENGNVWLMATIATKRRVAVIGAGWAGAAAALTLSRLGGDRIQITIFEAAKIAGGRARRVEKNDRAFDNGQHLLLGAYQRSLAMIESLHAPLDRVFERRPLSMQTAPNVAAPLAMRSGMAPAPIHLLLALLGAKGLSIVDKLRTCLWSSKYLLRQYPARTMTVAEIITDQPSAVRALLWEPLCVAALNTPAERASARVFVEVLRRSFLGDARSSDMIIPRVDLSALLPEPALNEVARNGGTVLFGEVVMDVERVGNETFNLRLRDRSESFDDVVVATGAQHVPRLLATLAADSPETERIVAALSGFAFEPISTLHFEFVGGLDAQANAMVMLDGAPGQWLFAHQLGNGHVRASVAISAHHREEPEQQLMNDGLAQLRRSYALPVPLWQQLVTEKRATYSCSPSQNQVLLTLPSSIGRLHFAGDWCVPELPATLESAVIAGENAARAVLRSAVTNA